MVEPSPTSIPGRPSLGPDLEPEPELDPELDEPPERASVAIYAQTEAAFGALLEELQSIQARCDERIDAEVQRCLSTKPVQLEIRQWVRAHLAALRVGEAVQWSRSCSYFAGHLRGAD